MTKTGAIWTGYGKTDRGLVRRTNQDALLVDNRRRLWAVADGMGGHPGGDVASRVAIDTCADFAPSLAQAGADPGEAEAQAGFRLTTMAERAHASVLAEARRRPELAGMGTTLTAARLLLQPTPRWLILNVGDSRVYLLRAGALTQLTRDHTYVEEQIRAGRLTEREAASHPDRHMLTRAIGVEPMTSDLIAHDVEARDVLLLCSDGLTKMLSDREIQDELSAHHGIPAECTQALMAAALARGGIDNVTVVVCALAPETEAANRH